MLIKPEILIISNKFDFSCDFITNKLKEFNVKYLRLNRDELGEYKIELNPYTPCLTAEIDDVKYIVSPTKLKSIYYRAPTFLRDIFQNDLPEEEQLYRTQWTAFVRSLIVFENIKWVNDPVATYKAEIKPFQLYYAKKVGFNVPETLISNYTAPGIIRADKVAIKSIDTAIISKKNTEAFIYTTIVENAELKQSKFSSPFFIQTGLIPKIDIRVTVIDNLIIAIKIDSLEGIKEDWRKYKGKINYTIFTLPDAVQKCCLKLARGLNLNFCAIDLIEYKEAFYFIEVNPTGEWSWLQKNTGYEFDTKICQSLIQ